MLECGDEEEGLLKGKGGGRFIPSNLTEGGGQQEEEDDIKKVCSRARRTMLVGDDAVGGMEVDNFASKRCR